MYFSKAAILSALLIPACTPNTSDLEQVSSYKETIGTSNRIATNRIATNKLAAQVVSSVAIATAQLADETWEFNQTESGGITDTEDGLMVLDYLIRCSMDPDTTITVVTTNGTHQYVGIMGLAPEWLTRGLDLAEQERVSGCLYAHVNHFGVTVMFSMRVPGLVGADATEQEQYKVHEGAFYGKYFVGENESIEWYACQGDRYDVAVVNSDNRVKRVCTDATSGCALTVTGACRDVCDTYTPGIGWSDCWGGGTQFSAVANAFLDASDPDAVNQTCGAGQTCTGAGAMDSGAGHSTILDGDGALAAEATCGAGSVCIMNGMQAASFSATLETDAIASVNCRQAGTCAVAVASGADAVIDCYGASTCTDITCVSGSSCLLDCGGATSCGFAPSMFGAIDCGGGVWVYGQTCP